MTRARLLSAEAMGSETLTRRRFETLRLFSRLVAEQAPGGRVARSEALACCGPCPG